MNTSIYIYISKPGIVTAFLMVFFSMMTVGQEKEISPGLRSLVRSGSKAGQLFFTDNPSLRASTLFTEQREAFGLAPDDRMDNYSAETDQLGYTTYRFQQYYKNLKVEFATVILNEKDGLLKTMIGNCRPGINLSITPLLTESAALQSALSHVNANRYFWQEAANEAFLKEKKNDPQATYYPKGELVIINDDIHHFSGTNHLAYRFRIRASDPAQIWDVYTDAGNGEILHIFNQLFQTDHNGTAITQYSGTRSIKTTRVDSLFNTCYELRESGRGGGIHTKNMNNKTDYSNLTEFRDDNNQWDNGNANMDQYATDAHWGAEMIYDYYLNRHGRNSWDNAGQLVQVLFHYGSDKFKAFYTPDDDIICVADGGANNNPLVSLDILAHEFTHAVTKYSAALVYQGESGALNEGFSDILATDCEFNTKGGNYQIAEETYLLAGGFLRSLSDPKSGSPPQPDTYEGANWYPTSLGSADHGGVHYNNGIINKWFYLLAEGGSGTNDNDQKYDVKGIGRDKAIKIAYYTLTTKLIASAQFLEARNGSVMAAKDLFPGDCSNEVLQCINAWYAVGVGDPAIQIDSSAVENASCEEEDGKISISVIGVSPLPPTYMWSNNATTQEITGLATGTYYVTVTDPNTLCTVDTAFVIDENINFSSFINKTDVSFCGGCDGSAVLVLTSVNGTPEITWSTGATTNSITDLTMGWYHVTVTDTSTRCELQDSVEINEPEVTVTIAGGGNRTYCKGEPSPTITLTAIPADTSACTFLWSTGAAMKNITVTEAGEYWVEVTNSTGCCGNTSTKVTIWERDCDDPDQGETGDDGDGDGDDGEENEWDIPIVEPQDPNEIVGPAGYGPDQFVAKSKDQAYTIHFENDPEFATAPALKVMVDVPFDNKADLSSMRLGDFGFGDFVFPVPPNTPYYNTRIDLSDSLGVYLDVTAGIDVNNHKGFWILQSIDPATGLEPTDPNLGFLLVNDTVFHRGEGYVSFTQRAKTNTVTGDTLTAKGSIIFDENDAIITNTWENVIDAVAPITAVEPLPAETDSARVQITISGSDDAGGSGLDHFTLYVSVDGGPFEVQGNYTPANTIVFNGMAGYTYRFFSIGKDHVGNAEVMKTAAEASIHFNIDRTVIEGFFTYNNAILTPMDNVSLSLQDTNAVIVDMVTTSSNGSYELEPGTPGTYLINAAVSKEWGGVNATDALLVLKHFTQTDSLAGLKLQAGDVNASGNLNAIDALLIAKRFTLLVDSFPAGNWLVQQDTISFADSTISYDFQTLCYGDVDGSYLPPGGKTEPSVRMFNQDLLTLNPGQEILLPIKVQDEYTIGAISLILHYPHYLFDIVDVTTELDKENTLVYTAQQGVLRIAWYSLNPIVTAPGSTLLNLKIKAKNLNATMFSTFSLGNEGSIANIHAREIPVVVLYLPKIKIDVPIDYYLLNNRPNPFTGTTTFEYGIPESAFVSLKIYNTLGAEVAQPAGKRQEKGNYSLVFDGSALEEGVYFARFEVEGETKIFQQTLRLVVIKQ